MTSLRFNRFVANMCKTCLPWR